MIYPTNKNSLVKTQKVTAKGTRIVDLGNQRVLEKRFLAQSNFKKKADTSDIVQMTPQDQKYSRLTNTRNLSICQNLSLSVNFGSVVGSSQREYIAVLEESTKRLQTKVGLLESELKKKEEGVNKDREVERRQSLKSQMRFIQLQNYYEQSRKQLLACSMELIDCKSVLCQTGNDSDKVASISNTLQKNENFLKSYSLGQEQLQRLVQQSDQSKILLQLRDLRQVTTFQQKIIQQLRNLKDIPSQLYESEKRLLRHEINRVFTENQQLKKELETSFSEYFEQLRTVKDFSPRCSLLLKDSFKALNEIDKLRQEKYKLSVENQFLEERLYQEKKESQKLTDTIQRLNEDIKVVRHRPSTPDFRQSKVHQQGLAQIEELQRLVEQLKQKLLVSQTMLEQANQRLRSQNDQLEAHRLSTPLRRQTEQLLNSNVSEISPIRHKLSYHEPSLRQLEEMLTDRPEAIKVLHSYIAKTEQTIQKTKGQWEHEKEQKEKILKWCKKIYELLKHSELSEQTIEQHLMELKSISSVKINRKIKTYLEEIETIVGNFERYEVREVEEQLAQYILALKKRGQVIHEVQNEDGSSIQLTDRCSEAFTDQQGHLSDPEV